jgi:hypothetical protein
VDVALSNLVVGRRPEGFIADQLLPVTPVANQSDMFYKFLHGENIRHVPGMTLRAPGTEARKVHMTVSSDTFFAPNYALGTDYPVEDIVNADAVLQWAESSALLITDRLMVDYEMRVAATAVETTNVGTVTTINTAWSNTTGSRPLDDIEVQKENYRQRTGVSPNVCIIPEGVMTFLRRNDQLRDIIFGDKGGLVTEALLAQAIGIPKILVPLSQVNTFGESETINGSWSLSDIWGPHFTMAKINLLAGMRTDTWINAFRWTSPLLGTPWAVQRHPFDAKAKKFDLEVGYYQAEKVVSADLAVRVASVI